MMAIYRLARFSIWGLLGFVLLVGSSLSQCHGQTSTAESTSPGLLQELQQLEDRLVSSLAQVDAKLLQEMQAKFEHLEKQSQTSPATTESDKHAIQFLIAKIRRLLDKLNNREPKAAHDLLKVLVRELPAGDGMRLEALELLFFDSAARGEIDAATVADYLREISQLAEQDNLLFQNLQFEVIQSHHQAISAGIDGALTGSARADELDRRIVQASKQLAEHGVDSSIAQLLHFGTVDLAEKLNDQRRLEQALGGLTASVGSEQVGEIWRALYWNKWLEQHIRRRRYAEAFNAAHHMLQCAEKMNSEEIYSIGMTQLAHLSMRLGDYATAKRMLSSERLAKFYEQSSDTTKICTWRVNLAKAFEGELELFPARNLLSEARQAAENSKDSAELQLLLNNNLGVNYYLAGELDDAEKMLAECLKSRQQLKEQGRIAIAEAMINVGWVKLARLDYDAAQHLFFDAAEMISREESESFPRYVEALGNASRAAALAGRKTLATEWIQKAERLSYSLAKSYLDTTWSAQDRLAIVQEARVHPESVAWPGVLDTYLEIAPLLEIPTVAQYQVVLRWKSLLDSYESRDRLLVPDDIRKQEQALLEKLREAYFRKVPLSQRGRLQNELKELEDRLRALKRGLSASPRDAAASVPTSLADANPLPKLGPGEVLLDVFQIRKYRPPSAVQLGSDSEVLAFVLTEPGNCQRISLGKVDALESAVGQWLEAITNEADNERALAEQVASMVQRPVLKTVDQIEKLIVRADGATYLLPWCALPGTEGKVYWIENVVIEMTRFTQSTFANQTQPTTTAPSLLLVGNVAYGSLSDQFAPLESTAAEIESINNLLLQDQPSASVTRLEAAQAHESRLLAELPAHSHIHLATHGYFFRRESADAFTLSSATSLLNSGVVLAAAENTDSGRDQYLSAAEILPLDLRSCECVMLSACETGLGKFRAGQGIEGLVSSFQSAGARRVISSLWKVPDKPTATLAAQFYRHLWLDKQSYSQALRQAQLDLLNSSDVDSKLPAAWAAWTCSTLASGDSR